MKNFFILLPLISVLVYILLVSYQEGPASFGGINGTGATGVTGCSCHNPSPTTTTVVSLQLLDAGVPVTSYIAGHTYTVQITGTQTSGTLTLPRFGFQVAIVKSVGSGTAGAVSAGSFSAAPTGTHLFTLGSINIFEHGPTSIPATTGTGGSGSTYVESIQWTAPATGTGSVKIYGTVNAVNGDGSDDPGLNQDKWNNTSSTIAELSVITGASAVCLGSNIPLTDATPGGVWSSSSGSVATVSTAGVVTGAAAGTATISYTLGGSSATKIITVSPLPGIITGTASVCAGLTTTLSDATSGGTWISNNMPIATIGASSGIVSGVVSGTSVISYVAPVTGCAATTIVTVNFLPSSISGASHVCIGSTTFISDVPAIGAWSSNNTSVVIVGSSTGTVTGISVGSATITYTLPNGCTSSRVETVDSLPPAITGMKNVCVGLTTILSDSVTGGTWTSSNTTVATIGSISGIVSGLVSGVSTISYIAPVTGCISTTVVTVNFLPSSISGAAHICSGSTTIISDIPAIGTWSSGNVSVVTVGSSTGIINGISAGTAVITYTLPNGCIESRVETIDALPAVITGTTNVCIGLTTTLTDTTIGGTWSSGNTTVAIIGSASGIASGLVAGTSIISYIAPVTGCVSTATLFVNPLPSIISGATHVCSGSTTILSDVPMTGTWSSGNTLVATAGSSTGIVTGISAGTAVITYTLPTGCIATRVETVDSFPTITGTTSVCIGLTTALGDLVAGGTWVSSNTIIAAVGTTGIVSGLTIGSCFVTYTAPVTGCTSVTNFMVNPLPATISGAAHICAGSTTILTDVPMTGTWSSGNTLVATAGSPTGIITGISAGTAIITYTLPTGCIATSVETIDQFPAITGMANVCIGLTTTLSDVVPGGTWTSSNITIATIGTSGIVSGLTVGSCFVSYTSPVTGCMSTTSFVVNPLPSTISGATRVCVGATKILSEAPMTGTWSSGNTLVATAGSSTGIITGISAGTVIITYTLPTGCIASRVETIDPLPATITGTTNVCIGFTTTLSDSTSGGIWLSSNPAIATIDTSGIVAGIVAGASVISYVAPVTGCISTANFVVNALPSTISGAMQLCNGSTTIISDIPMTGTWSSSNTSVVTAGSSTGIITAVSVGTAIITYTLPTGCIATGIETVNPLPFAGPIIGKDSLCPGDSLVLGDTVAGGAWISITGNATVSATGIVKGIAAGFDTIDYVVFTVCGSDTARLPLYVRTPEECIGTINVYPNPNSGIFYIEISEPYTGGSIRVTDVLGNIIQTTNISDQKVRIDALNANNIPPGSYFIIVNTSSKTYRKKVTVVK